MTGGAQWTIHVLFGNAMIEDFSVEDLHGHPGLIDASQRLAKPVDANMR